MTLLLRVRRLYLWQSQRDEVVIADRFPVLVGVAEGVAAKPKFIMKVFPVRPHKPVASTPLGVSRVAMLLMAVA